MDGGREGRREGGSGENGGSVYGGRGIVREWREEGWASVRWAPSEPTCPYSHAQASKSSIRGDDGDGRDGVVVMGTAGRGRRRWLWLVGGGCWGVRVVVGGGWWVVLVVDVVGSGGGDGGDGGWWWRRWC